MPGLAQAWQRLYEIGVEQNSKTQIDYTAYHRVSGKDDEADIELLPGRDSTEREDQSRDHCK